MLFWNLPRAARSRRLETERISVHRARAKEDHQDMTAEMECLAVLTSMLEVKTILACGIVMLNPLFWNVLSRLEYRTQLVSKVTGGPRRGVTVLAAGILFFNYVRTSIFHKVMDYHTTCEPMQNPYFNAVGFLFVITGTILVISSSYQLGFFGSFMGDYFGLLLEEKVTNFPFSVVDDPMYVGSGLVYLGFSFQNASVVGLVLTGFIALSYVVAILIEKPFTVQIYANKEN